MKTQELLKQGMEALKIGKKLKARKLLLQVVQADTRNETAWLWLSAAVDTDRERRNCLERALAINPESTAAQKGIQALERNHTQETEACPTTVSSSETSKQSGLEITSPLHGTAVQRNERVHEDTIDPETLQNIKAVLHDLMGVSPSHIGPQTRLREDLKMTPPDVMEFMLAMNVLFEIEIDDEQAARTTTVYELAHLISSLQKGSSVTSVETGEHGKDPKRIRKSPSASLVANLRSRGINNINAVCLHKETFSFSEQRDSWGFMHRMYFDMECVCDQCKQPSVLHCRHQRIDSQPGSPKGGWALMALATFYARIPSEKVKQEDISFPVVIEYSEMSPNNYTIYDNATYEEQRRERKWRVDHQFVLEELEEIIRKRHYTFGKYNREWICPNCKHSNQQPKSPGFFQRIFGGR